MNDIILRTDIDFTKLMDGHNHFGRSNGLFQKNNSFLQEKGKDD
ncbi:uncharacterized protein METZ01_LOCUS173408 [marine metagenome]|uniref:Uncharacterized protein n=1 Tax=marine metagenome TaxID=408172 RepID=A0A382C3T6_9ZZZZ